VTASADRPLYLKQLEVGLMQNFVYLIGDPATHEALIVDPGWEVDRILRALEQDGYRPTQLLLSHSHLDHINGVEDVLERFDVPVYAQKEELEHLPSSWRKKVTGLAAGDRLTVGQLPVTVLHTPGHTPGSQCVLIDDKLVTGDTLFVGSCGRTDLPGGSPRQLHESLTKTFGQLDDQTLVYPGHNYGAHPTSTLGAERRDNPFLQCARVEDFLRMVTPTGWR